MKCQDPEYQIDSNVASFLASMLPEQPTTVLDPQCGQRNLVGAFNYSALRRFGIEVEGRYCDYTYGTDVINATTMHTFEEIKELTPGLQNTLHWDAIVAYPPARTRWLVRDVFVGNKEAHQDKKMSAFAFTLKLGIWYSNYGYVIGDAEDIMELDDAGLMPSQVTQRFPIPQCGNELIAVYYERDKSQWIPTIDRWELQSDWIKVKQVVREGKLPKYQIDLKSSKTLEIHIGEKWKILNKYTMSEESKVNRLRDERPSTLAIDLSGRKTLEEAIALENRFTFSPEAKEEIEKALSESVMLSTPIMPPTDFELCAYADEQEKLMCHTTDPNLGFTAGKEYKISSKLFEFNDTFTRNKVHYDGKSQETYMMEHDCILVGQDRMLLVENDNYQTHRYMDRPDANNARDHEELDLWKHFEKPKVNDLAVQEKAKYDDNIKKLEVHEVLAGFDYLSGQKDYIARLGVRDFGLCSAETGAGKTLMCLSLTVLKHANRVLVLAPQGTTRGGGDDALAQWQSEIKKFAPYFRVFEIFRWKDIIELRKSNGGTLPKGIYLSYYEAFFYQGTIHKGRAIQTYSPDSSKDADIWKILYPDAEVPVALESSREWVKSLGVENAHGIRCIATPGMSTMVGDEFDMICMDEAHRITNLKSQITSLAIRMQPKYRYCFSASPIPNHVGNIFSIMGWLCVPDWYKGGRSNAAWPFTIKEAGKFASTFLSVERDLTEERIRRRNEPGWRGKCIKTSPILSRASSLLKLLKPTLGFITKAQCNPDYVPPEVIDIRVPMGKAQAKLYAHYMDRGNINQKNAMVRAAVQSAYLRNVCCDPATCEQNGEVGTGVPHVASNFNPKVVSILEMSIEMLARGEQVVIVSARKGISDELERRFGMAKIPVSRLDSTVPTKDHAFQSAQFKEKKSKVMLMGIKCAEGHSYDQCSNLIVTSLEYSYGSFLQAQGRVDRLLSKGAKIYCVLHKASIEEVMFDTVATKGDAATICLRGERIPRMWKPADMSEILADSIAAFDGVSTEDEATCEAKWDLLKRKLEIANKR